MKHKEVMFKELKKAHLEPGWLGDSIRIGTELMVRFYPDMKTYELLRFSFGGWKTMAKTTDTYTITLVARAQKQLIDAGVIR